MGDNMYRLLYYKNGKFNFYDNKRLDMIDTYVKTYGIKHYSVTNTKSAFNFGITCHFINRIIGGLQDKQLKKLHDKYQINNGIKKGKP